MTTVTATVRTGIAARETLDLPASNNPTITHAAFDRARQLNATSDPPVTKVAAFELTLSGGAATIDLTALEGSQGTVDGTGAKVQALLVNNPAGNNPVTIAPGAANAYDIFGGATEKVTMAADGSLCWRIADGLPDISASAKEIDVTGTGSETIECAVLLG